MKRHLATPGQLAIWRACEISQDQSAFNLFVDELLQDLSGAEIPEPGTQYADFCEWQQLQLANGHLDLSRNFWLDVYREGAPTWDLPSDRPRPAIRDNSMGVHAAALPPDLAPLLRAVAGRAGTSPFRVAFAAFFAFLHRITGQADLMTATTLIGRSDPRFAGLIGFFVNTGGIRITIQDATRFDELAAAVDAAISAAVEHQSYPFAQAAADVNPRHEPGRSPLTPVAFTKMPTSRLRSAAGLEVSDGRVFLGEVGHDVSVYMQDDCGVFRFTWTYRTALFDPSTIERFEGWFREVLRRGLERPETPVSQLDFVSLQERRRILLDWNDTAREFPEARSVHAMVEAQVERSLRCRRRGFRTGHFASDF